MLQQQARPYNQAVAVEIKNKPQLPQHIPQHRLILVSSHDKEKMTAATNPGSVINPISDILSKKLEQLQRQGSVGDTITKTDSVLMEISRRSYPNQLSVRPN